MHPRSHTAAATRRARASRPAQLDLQRNVDFCLPGVLRREGLQIDASAFAADNHFVASSAQSHKAAVSLSPFTLHKERRQTHMLKVWNPACGCDR